MQLRRTNNLFLESGFRCASVEISVAFQYQFCSGISGTLLYNSTDENKISYISSNMFQMLPLYKGGKGIRGHFS